MPDEFTLNTENLDKVLDRLYTFAPKLQRKGLRGALRKGAAVVRKALRENAKRIDDPGTSTAIYRNVAMRSNSKAGKKVGGAVYNVGIRGGAATYADSRWNRAKRRAGKKYATDGGKGNPGGDTFHWRFIEFGTRYFPAAPFARPALENNVTKATDAVAKGLEKEIDKIARQP